MYFMYNSGNRFNLMKINETAIDGNNEVVNKLDLVYKNNNNGIIMENANVLIMRPATPDEIELFKCSELIECE